MMKQLIWVGAFAALLSCQDVLGQDLQPARSVSVTGAVTVGEVRTLTLSVSGPSSLDFNNFTTLKEGLVIPGYFTVEVRSNTPWRLIAKFPQGYFEPMADLNAAAKMTANVLSLRASTGSSFMPLNAEGIVIARGEPTTTHASTISVDIAANPSYRFPASRQFGEVYFELVRD